jgi:hypothetical protein
MTLSLDQQTVRQYCAHCGQEFDVSRGSAFEDGEPIALYLAGLHTCHGPPIAHVAIAIRPGYKDNERTEAIVLQMWTTEDSFAMQVTDATESPWSAERYLGHLLDRADALKSPLLATVFHIAGHVARDNVIVASYLDAEPNDPR